MPDSDEDFAAEAINHLDSLYRGALRLTRDPEQAQDLVQDTYVRALRYQHSFHTGTNMRAWLFSIMRNRFWDRLKTQHPGDVSLDDSRDDFPLYERVKDEADGPETLALNRIAATEVVAAVEKLPALHREIVQLVDVEGFSYKDTAEVLDIPIGTVMSRLHRARQQLQKELYQYARESGILAGKGTE
ncbi:MAG TPA: sigma-70 family RNA polymerase sigma factor [Candidatus Dormibacteraeota bacterium]|nr:sigma-70 family RNA polymerase sigma factor [Candidatus Dormibacteraeota bacterium]